jgi:hypothetical protein
LFVEASNVVSPFSHAVTAAGSERLLLSVRQGQRAGERFIDRRPDLGQSRIDEPRCRSGRPVGAQLEIGEFLQQAPRDRRVLGSHHDGHVVQPWFVCEGGRQRSRIEMSRAGPDRGGRCVEHRSQHVLALRSLRLLEREGERINIFGSETLVAEDRRVQHRRVRCQQSLVTHLLELGHQQWRKPRHPLAVDHDERRPPVLKCLTRSELLSDLAQAVRHGNAVTRTCDDFLDGEVERHPLGGVSEVRKAIGRLQGDAPLQVANESNPSILPRR